MSNPDDANHKDEQKGAPPSGEQKPKDLKEILAEFAQKNRTLFCVCLAFSIWFYHGMFDVSTSFGARVKSSSETLFVIQVFLTAFAVSRFMVFIDIQDMILRNVNLFELIYLFLCRESRIHLISVLKYINAKKIPIDQIKDHGIINISVVYKAVITNDTFSSYRAALGYLEQCGAVEDVEFNDFNEFKKKNGFSYTSLGRSILAVYRVREEGYFREKIWLPRLKKNKKLLIMITIVILAIIIYAIYKWFNPTPIPVITPEQLFFSYVNKHFL